MSATPRVLPGNGPFGGLPTFEEPEVARYLSVEGSDAGFTIPNPEFPISDLHLQQIHAPGLIAGRPAMLFFRTRHTAGSRFSLRLNATRVFEHTAPASGAQAWHEILQPGVLKAEDNELTLFVAHDGSVVFSDIIILYTSNKLTVTKPLVLEPAHASAEVAPQL